MDAASRSILTQPSSGAHVGMVVQDDRTLAEAVATWAAESLRRKGGAILVGTPVHLETIRAAIRAQGIEIEAEERAGRVVMIDADWLMAQFMLDGTPDAIRFRHLLDEILARVGSVVGSPARVRAWGEMVSLLRLRDDAEGARRIESLWAGAIAAHGFSLLCSYHTGGVDVPPSRELLADVAHSHMLCLPAPDAAAPSQ